MKGRRPARIARLKRGQFLANFALTGNVQEAAQAAGIGRRTHYDWLKSDPAYEQAYQVASEDAADRMEREAYRRAVEGTDKPVYQGGHLVGTVREYSDVLLIFLLKGIRPEKFRERVEHSGKGTSFVMMFERPLADPLRDDETVLDVAALPPAEDDKTA